MVIKPTVSVVIPFFNGSRWIQRALESVYSQTTLPNQVIVVNDGSDATEVDFLSDLENKYEFTLLSQENKGQSAARNLGVKESNSEFICLLDQDDYFLTNHIESLLSIADSDNPSYSFSYGDLYRVSQSGELISNTCINVKNQHPLKNIAVMLRNNMYILPSATLIKRSAFLSVGGFDEALQGYEDDDLFLRFFRAGFTNSFTPEAVSAWTVNSESTSYSEAMTRSRYLYFLKLLRSFVLEKDSDYMDSNVVFCDLLFPRFSLNFANDVVSSALGDRRHFLERVERLKSFRGQVKSDTRIKSQVKYGYLISTLPLVVLGPGTQRFLLRLLLWALQKFGAFNNPVLLEFLRLHSPLKESFN